MKVIDVLEEFIKDLNEFLGRSKDSISADNIFFILIDDVYYDVNMKRSYWRYEDDGTVVFVVNDEDE